jgi:hypothetical protein
MPSRLCIFNSDELEEAEWDLGRLGRFELI